MSCYARRRPKRDGIIGAATFLFHLAEFFASHDQDQDDLRGRDAHLSEI
jgi:hypothetical protein